MLTRRSVRMLLLRCGIFAYIVAVAGGQEYAPCSLSAVSTNETLIHGGSNLNNVLVNILGTKGTPKRTQQMADVVDCVHSLPVLSVPSVQSILSD